MEMMTGIMALAVMLEAVIEVVKGMTGTWDAPAWMWPAAGAALGVLLCIAAGVDLLGAAGVALGVPYLGAVLTGVLISRGASFVHDVWGRVKAGAGEA